MRNANRHHALDQIEARLRAGADVFQKLIVQRNQQITHAAGVLSRDHAFQEVFADAEHDRATTLSALESLRGRVKADVVLISSLKKELLFNTQQPEMRRQPFPFPRLVEKAESDESTNALVYLGDQLYAMAVAPLLAPDPIAWLCPGFRVDDEFAREIKTYTDLEITFLNDDKILATTFGPNHARRIAPLRAGMFPPGRVLSEKLAGEDFLSYAVALRPENGTALALLQRSLDRELAPYLRLERIYLGLAVFGLLVSAALGTWIARSVTEPVMELAEGARDIAAGNYRHHVDVDQQDELGELAAAFNRMSDGLLERDRVRDLLGKVVSPEVATELLRKEIVLGGEEREVTILFSDIRNFTSLSEGVTPQLMVELLNDYFTRMSAIVEKHGGVVDKYVGDAVMALFGAPVTNLDDADRAMRAALEMTTALEELNRSWQARGRPRLEIGIGLNTGTVVAGNMGSERRLNYTVIGDGVNVAARLEELTKHADYNATIIVSASTLAKAKEKYETRALGRVTVKGRQGETEIFALVGREA